MNKIFDDKLELYCNCCYSVVTYKDIKNTRFCPICNKKTSYTIVSNKESFT